MQKAIEIQKKKQLVILIVFFFLLIGGAALWVLLQFLLPMLAGFWKFKVYAVGAVCAAVIAGIVLVVKQSSKKTPGLIINELGITDESNIASVGFIPWNDITGIKEAANEFKHKLIVVMVRNPEVYIHKTSKFSASRQIQYQQFGSPILISTHSLDFDTQELVAILKVRATIHS